ncbi:MAG: hypothetical protein CMG27_00480 [Candidatus Marinimicrobia bacterium]|nr:hypothetical protein [Candidatus Neomarinimicrobiota bacterium]
MKKSSVETINSETLIQFHKTLEEGWNHNWTPHSLAKLILSHRSRSIGHMLEECKLVTFAYTHMRKKKRKAGWRKDGGRLRQAAEGTEPQVPQCQQDDEHLEE